MSAEYVRRAYGVSFKRGDRVVLHDHGVCSGPSEGRCDDTRPDRIGTVVSFPGQYVGVRFDGEKHTARCHPAWHLLARPSH